MSAFSKSMINPTSSEGVTISERRRRRPSSYSASLVGNVNDRPLQVRGRGAIEQGTGRVHGHYKLDRVPAGLHPRLLNAVMVTGYPSVCQESPDAVNPFAFGSYSYTRTLDFGERGRLSYTARCLDTETGPVSDIPSPWLESHFEITGNVEIPALVSTAPLIETWTPVSGRQVDGCFTMAWRTESGQLISAVARTEYLLPEEAVLPSEVMYRCIQLHNTLDNTGVLEIDQRSRLLSENAVREMTFPRD